MPIERVLEVEIFQKWLIYIVGARPTLAHAPGISHGVRVRLGGVDSIIAAARYKVVVGGIGREHGQYRIQVQRRR